MKNSIRLGTLFGIPITLHSSFLLFLAMLAAVYLFQGGPAAAVRGVAFILAVFVSVTLHELGHSLVARSYGIKVREIALLPIGGISHLETMPTRPAAEFLISLAGPATSVVVGLLLGLVSLFLYGFKATIDQSLAAGPFLANLARVNLLIAIFNLLPGFPMDGGRIFRAILANRMSYTQATAIAATVGRIFAIVLGIVGLFYNLWLVFIALFIFFGATQEESQVRIRTLLHGVPVSRVMATTFQTLSPDDPISRAVEHAYHGFQEDFPVTSAGRVVGMLQKNDLLAALHRHGPQVPVAEVMQIDFVSVNPEQTLEEVYQAIQNCRCSSLPVIANDTVFGVVTLEALGRFFAFAGATGSRQSRG